MRLAAYPHHGPSLVANVIDLPHDAFPENGTLDLVNPGTNSIRFDSGNVISRYEWGTRPNDPGDARAAGGLLRADLHQRRADGVHHRRRDAEQRRPVRGRVRLAEFTDPNGAPGQYPYSAATLNVRTDFGARVISLPYDFQSVETADGAKADAQLAARVRLLQDVLAYFGAAGGSAAPSAVPDAGVLFAGNHPNPFNPATTIRWSLPRAGHLGLDVFDVRGRLVRTLADGPAPAGAGEVRWDGRAGDGRMAAAGVYFYRLQAGDQTLVGKMALIK